MATAIIFKFIEFMKKEKIWSFLAFIIYTCLITSLFFPTIDIIFLIALVPILLFTLRIQILVLSKDINLNEIKCKIKAKIYKIFPEILMYIPVHIICNVFTNIFISGNSQNQLELLEDLENSPINFLIYAIIIAPIIEEILFRLLPYQFIKNKYLYIGISAFVFASCHVINDTNAFYYIWAYIFESLYFSYRFFKTKDIFVTISLHSFCNLVAFSLTLLL